MARQTYRGFDLPDGNEIPDVPADLRTLIDGVNVPGNVVPHAMGLTGSMYPFRFRFGSGAYTTNGNGDYTIIANPTTSTSFVPLIVNHAMGLADVPCWTTILRGYTNVVRCTTMFGSSIVAVANVAVDSDWIGVENTTVP